MNHNVPEIARLRMAQLQINKMIEQERFKIPIHLALGHEAIAISVVDSMKEDDKVLLNHRNIHYHLALGATVDELIREYELQADGLANGKCGSMNLLALNNRNVYTSNILGNNLSVALGVAKAGKISRMDSVVWVVTGDGAIEEGAFYESILCASSWKLPIIYVIENNRWSLGTEIEQRRINISLEKFANSMDVQFLELKGNVISHYVNSLNKAREMAQSLGPVIVEFHVETLGGYWVEESSGKRYINYHAGKTLINHQDGVINENESDPLFVNYQVVKVTSRI